MAKKTKKSKLKKVEDFKKVKLKVGKTLKKTRDTIAHVASKTINLTTQLETAPGLKDKQELLLQVRHHNSKIKVTGIRNLMCEVSSDDQRVRDWLPCNIFTSILPLISDADADVRKHAIALITFLLKHVRPLDLTPYYALIVGHLNFSLTHISSPVRECALAVVVILLESHPILPMESSVSLWSSVLQHSCVPSQNRAQKLTLAKSLMTLLLHDPPMSNKNGSMKKLQVITQNDDIQPPLCVSLITQRANTSPFDFAFALSNPTGDSHVVECQYIGPLKTVELTLTSAPKLWNFVFAFWTEITTRDYENNSGPRFTNAELDIMEILLKILLSMLDRVNVQIGESEGSADCTKLRAMCRGLMTKKYIVTLTHVLPCTWKTDDPKPKQKGEIKLRSRPVWPVNLMLAQVLVLCSVHMPEQASSSWINQKIVEEHLEKARVKNNKKLAKKLNTQKNMTDIVID